MKKYVTRFLGENFLLNIDSTNGKYGFCATRNAEGYDANDAQCQAEIALWKELAEQTRNSEDDCPTISTDEIWEVSEFDSEKSGFTFYPESRSLMTRLSELLGGLFGRS